MMTQFAFETPEHEAAFKRACATMKPEMLQALREAAASSDPRAAVQRIIRETTHEEHERKMVAQGFLPRAEFVRWTIGETVKKHPHLTEEERACAIEMPSLDVAERWLATRRPDAAPIVYSCSPEDAAARAPARAVCDRVLDAVESFGGPEARTAVVIEGTVETVGRLGFTNEGTV